ncbi:hypothetical protein Golax_008589, partial [Gossypium laxum]|nr:hypothetical protein [Gossypium laxum]
ECTITLEDVALQLSLTVDRLVSTRSAIVPSKVNLCQSLLGKVPYKFKSVRETKLGICRIVHVESGDVSSHATKCDVDQWLSTSIVIVGLVATTISTSQGDRPIYVPVGGTIVELRGLHKDLEDIRLFLDQRSEAERQRISLPSQDLKELHKVDMRGNDNIDWLKRYNEHMWPDTTMVNDYLAWFKVVVKSHLLSPEGRSRQIWAKRSQRPPQHTRRGRDHTTGLSFVSAKDALPVAAQYSGHFGQRILIQLSNLVFYSQAPPHYGPPPHMAGSSILASTYFTSPASPTYYTPKKKSMSNPVSGKMSAYPSPPMQAPMQQSLAMLLPGTFLAYPGFWAPYGFTPIRSS